MSDSLGQGFTASIVNNTANYISADKSTMGMVDGSTGLIQYVKLVWGGSGESNFVSESGTDPSALPVSLANADNNWLISSFVDAVHRTSSGLTAFRVAIDGAGLCFAGACFGNINLASSLQISSFGTGATNANLGVTFGVVGLSGNYVAIRNYRGVAGSGTTESLWITGGVYLNPGSTVAISNSLSLNLSAGMTIAGITAGLTLPVTFSSGVSLGWDQVNARINEIKPGITVGVALTTPGGTFYPGAYVGVGVFGVSGATALGTTFGTVGITTIGSAPLGVTFAGSLTTTITFPATGVTVIHGNTSLGVTFSGNLGITTTGNGLLGVTFSEVRMVPASGQGTTFGVVLTNGAGTPLGLCGNFGVAGIPVFGVTGATAIAVTIVGGLSGVQISGISIGDIMTITGGTLGQIRGGTLDFIGKILGFGSAITIANGTFGAFLAGGTGAVHLANTTTNPGIVRLVDFNSSSGLSLRAALDGVTVSIAGFGSSGLLFTGVSLAGGALGPTGSTYMGVTLHGGVNVSNMVSMPSVFAVKGDTTSRTTDPVGAVLTGPFNPISGSTISRDAAHLLGVTLVGISSANGALLVSVAGGLSGITVSGISFPDRMGVYNISGQTAIEITFGTKPGGITFSGPVSITAPAVLGVTFGVIQQGKTLAVFLTKPDGSLYDNNSIGVAVVGITGATPIAITNDAFRPLAVTFTNNEFTTNLFTRITGGAGHGATFVPSAFGGLLGVTLSGPWSGITAPLDSSGNSRYLGVTFVGTLSAVPTTGITLSGATIFRDLGFGYLGVTFGPTMTNVGVTFVGPFAGLTAPLDSAGTSRYLGVTFVGTLNASVPTTGITLSGTTIFRDLGFGYLGVTFGPTMANVGVTFVGPFAGITAPLDSAGTSRYLGVTFGPTMIMVGVTNVASNPLGVTFGTGKIPIIGDVTSSIGVTLGSGGAVNVAGVVQIFATAGMLMGTTVSGPMKIVPNSVQGTTIGVVVAQGNGQPFTGGTWGVPVFGMAGAPLIGVTFTGISFATTPGVTFGGITFNTTRTILVGSSFADGGNNLGVPVYGVLGSTAVRVQVEGGTIAGIFVTETAGITVMGVTTGIPIIGVTGGVPIGITWAGNIPATVTFPSAGFTIANVAEGVTIGVTGTVVVSSLPSVSVTTLPTLTLNQTSDVPIKASSSAGEMPSAAKLNAGTAERGVVVTEKGGAMFARGFTLSAFIGVTNMAQSGVFPAGSNPFGFSGPTAYYFTGVPIALTKNYSGDYRDGNSPFTGEPSVPLKQGVYVQFTKWDMISHLLVGYTAPSLLEFERNAQVMTKEYQMAPIWAHAMDQFRRFPGATGNNTHFMQDDTNPAPTNTVQVLFGSSTGGAMVQKQFIGLVEKPTRIFMPCKDAGEIYLLPKADWFNHTIGSGFWDEETGEWSPFSLYDRSHWASEVFGFSGGTWQAANALALAFTGGEPNLSVTGAGTSFATNYGLLVGGGTAGATLMSISGSGLSGGNALIMGRMSAALNAILASYANNPVVRVWGY